MFKGVCIRYLGQLRDTLQGAGQHPEVAARLDGVIRSTVASMLKNSIGDDGCYTVSWEEGAKDRSTSFNTQTSGLAALVSALPGRAVALQRGLNR
jgi:hypothetical protein